MLKIGVVTLFPEMITETSRHGLLGQALKKNLLEISVSNPRDFTQDRHRTVDDRPFGGGDGMVLLSEPLEQALVKMDLHHAHVVYLSPQGKTFNNEKAREFAGHKNLVFICGRYGGIDQRIINHYVDEEISIGDYVLSGGEMAALVVIEAVSRFIPGVLGHEESAEKDSFAEGLLEHPHFTRPREYLGEAVPEALLSGNHALMEEWKKKIALLVTYKKRPDLYQRYIKIDRETLSASPAKKKKNLVQELQDFYLKMNDDDKRALNLENIEIEDLNV